MAFWALIVPVMMAAGFDRMAAAGIILLSSGVRGAGLHRQPVCHQHRLQFAGIFPSSEVGLQRVIQWLLLVIFASWFVMRYAKQVQQDKSRSINWPTSSMTTKFSPDEERQSRLPAN